MFRSDLRLYYAFLNANTSEILAFIEYLTLVEHE